MTHGELIETCRPLFDAQRAIVREATAIEETRQRISLDWPTICRSPNRRVGALVIRYKELTRQICALDDEYTEAIRPNSDSSGQ